MYTRFHFPAMDWKSLPKLVNSLPRYKVNVDLFRISFFAFRSSSRKVTPMVVSNRWWNFWKRYSYCTVDMNRILRAQRVTSVFEIAELYEAQCAGEYRTKYLGVVRNERIIFANARERKRKVRRGDVSKVYNIFSAALSIFFFFICVPTWTKEFCTPLFPGKFICLLTP